MKTSEEVENLPEGTVLWDKMTRDHEENPLQWKIVGPHQKARHNSNVFIRRMELSFELTDDEKLDLTEKQGLTAKQVESLRGYKALSQDNMYDFTTNETLARLSFAMWDLEDGVTPDNYEALQKLVAQLSNDVVDPEESANRLKKMGIL